MFRMIAMGHRPANDTSRKLKKPMAHAIGFFRLVAMGNS